MNRDKEEMEKRDAQHEQDKTRTNSLNDDEAHLAVILSRNFSTLIVEDREHMTLTVWCRIKM